MDADTPTLTEEEFENRNYECIGGKYFTEEGKYVPLSNRPAPTTQEKVLKDHPTVVDVVICGMSTFVHVTDKSEMDNISSILSQNVGERLHKVIQENSSRDSEYVLIYRP